MAHLIVVYHPQGARNNLQYQGLQERTFETFKTTNIFIRGEIGTVSLNIQNS